MTSEYRSRRSQAITAALPRLLDLSAPAVALAITAILVLERTPRKEPLVYLALVGALVAMTWASARSRSAYGLWGLYTGAFALFSVMRAFADETGLSTHVGDLVAAERVLGLGTVPTTWLQERLFNPAEISWLDRATAYVHWSYFVLPHVFAVHLFLYYRQVFVRYVLLFAGVLAVGLALAFAFPAAPPWVASLRGELEPTYKIVTEVGSELNVNIYRYFETQIRNSNPVAAMPSIHMAVSFAVLLTSFRVSRALAAAAIGYNAAMGFSLVYLGEHYVVDVLAGVAVTSGVYAALEVWYRLRPGAEAAMELEEDEAEGPELLRPTEWETP